MITEDILDCILAEVQTQDVAYFFGGLSGNPATRRRLSEYFQGNFDEFQKRFERNFSLDTLIKVSFRLFTSEQDATQSETFIKSKNMSEYGLVLAQALEMIRTNAAWLERDAEDVGSWLEAWTQGHKT